MPNRVEIRGSRTLQQLLDSRKALHPEDAIRVVLDVALALENEHKNGRILHGVFPDQIRINLPSGSQLMPLEAIRDPDDLTVSYLYFVPPECLEKQLASPQSDLYSMGVILYALLAGRVPFVATTREALLDEIQKGAQPLPPAASRPDLEWIIRKCLLHSPERRFQSALDLATELKKCANPQRVIDKIAVHKPEAFRFLQQKWKILLAIAGVSVLLTTSALVLLLREPPPSDPKKWQIVRVTAGRFDEKEPTLSQDGTSIAFVSNKKANWELYVVDTKGGEPLQITRSPGFEENPRWSPSGDQILYTYRAPNAKPTIYSISSSGGVPQQLVSDAIDAQWAPDGSEICYVSPAQGPVRSLYVFNLIREESRVVLKDVSGLSHPSFSANKKELVVSIDGHLELVRSKSGKRRVLTKGLQDLFPTWNWITGSIYYSAQIGDTSQIWRVDRKGKQTQVIRSDRKNFRPVPSVSGDRIAFHRHNTLTDLITIHPESGSITHVSPSSNDAIFSARPQSTDPQKLLLSEALRDSIDVAQRPARKTLAVLTARRIFLVDMDSGNQIPILTFLPGEHGTRIGWSQNGKNLYCERTLPGSDLYFLKGNLNRN